MIGSESTEVSFECNYGINIYVLKEITLRQFKNLVYSQNLVLTKLRRSDSTIIRLYIKYKLVTHLLWDKVF